MGTLALYSIKGGVGKTAAAVNLAFSAQQAGAHVLLIDLDPQASASFYFRTQPRKKFDQESLLSGGKEVLRGIRGTDYEGLDLLPANLSYRNLDLALDSKKRSRKQLKDILQPLGKAYDWIIIDCPPNLTLLSENVFSAADALVVPFVPTTLSTRTYEQLIGFLREQDISRRKLVPFFSMVERRKSMHKAVMAEAAGKRFLKTTVPYSAVVEKMGLTREPVAVFSPRSKAAVAFGSLWEEIAARV
ncbi:MAG TPA: cobyrinic acid a,c-diamide synthase [Lentisphaeria bacterium]|nr:cobyrinic acid a,c-diamide synthase [Lentisphaeria bacterium]